MKKIKYTAMMMLITSVAMAQSTSANADMTFQYVWLTIMSLLLLVLLLLVYTLKRVVTILKIETNGGVYEEAIEERSFWEKMFDLKPISAEKEIEMDHEYDGIRELNNPIPFWFNILFYGSVVAAIIYMMVFQVFNIGDLQTQEYEKEMAQAEISKQEYVKKAGNLIDENSVVMLSDVSKIKEGATLFASKCVVCHGDKGQGIVGPNLTDEYWLHGGDIHSVFKTIKYGVPSKGMVAWQNSMNGAQMQELASYILTLKGTNPAGAKEPQGEKETTTAEVSKVSISK